EARVVIAEAIDLQASLGVLLPSGPTEGLAGQGAVGGDDHPEAVGVQRLRGRRVRLGRWAHAHRCILLARVNGSVTGVAEAVGLGVEQGVQRLLDGVAGDLVAVLVELALLDADHVLEGFGYSRVRFVAPGRPPGATRFSQDNYSSCQDRIQPSPMCA